MEIPSNIGMPNQGLCLHSLCIKGPFVTPESSNLTVIELFDQNKNIVGMPVLENNRPIGMINRHILLSQMTRPFYRELYDQKSCIAFMDKEPLVIDINSSLEYLADRVVSTGDKAISEGFIFTRGGEYVGIGLGIDLIKMVSDLQSQQHKQIMQSIEYARVIQESLLENANQSMARQLDDWCLFWQPRDCVGGDFYAFHQYEKGWLAVVADCTGHGVPGAFMTVIFTSALEKALDSVPPDEPDRLLQELNQHIKHSLSQGEIGHQKTLSNDGCDAIALYVDTVEQRLIWSNANMSTFLLPAASDDVVMLAKERMGIGYVETPADFHWSRHEYLLKKGDKVFIVTDGVTDQIGGEKEIMFGRKRIEALLKAHKHQPMSAFSEALKAGHSDWKAKQNPRDDMTWFGFGWQE